MIPVYKIVFDISFYYALSSFYLFALTGNSSSAWGGLVLFISTGIFVALGKLTKIPNDGKKNRPVVLLCYALPSLLFAFNPTLWQIIQYLPAWAFLAVSVWKNRLNTNRVVFEYHFIFTGRILGVAILGFLALFFGWMDFHARVFQAFSIAVPYLVVWLTSGVCLMRILREEGKLSGSRNIVIMLTLMAAMVIAILPGQFFQTAVSFIHQNIIVWIITGLAYIVGFSMYWLYLLLSRFTPNIAEEGDSGGSWDELLREEGIYFTIKEPPLWLDTVMLVALVLAVMFVVFRIMRKLLGNRIEDGDENFHREETEKLAKPDHGSRRFFRPKDPREAVRWYFRKYLKEGVARGRELLPADTSLSVLRKLAPLFPDGYTEKLRGIYILARYRFSSDTQKADATAASEIWRIIKK